MSNIQHADLVKAFLQHQQLGVLLLDQEGTILEAAGGAFAWLDRTLVGHSLASLTNQPMAVIQFLEELQQAPAEVTIRIRQHESDFMVDPVTGALTNPQQAQAPDHWWRVRGEVTNSGTVLTILDISDQIMAQTARDEVLIGIRSLLWYADVTEDLDEIRWDLHIINESTGQILMPLDIPEGQTWHLMWVASRYPEDSERINRTSAEALRNNDPSYSQVFRCTAADGSTHWFREDVQIQSVAPGSWHLIGISTDVTDIYIQDQHLREFQSLASNALDPIIVFDSNGAIRYVNQATLNALVYSKQEDLYGVRAHEIIAVDDFQRLVDEVIPVLHKGWRGNLNLARSDGTIWPAQISVFALLDQNQAHHGIALIARDLSEHQRHEEERHALQDQLIETQRAILRELSTPLIPLADGIIVMPLVGTIDTARAQQVLETLLEGISGRQADVAILDITGVKVIDTQVADSLIRVARAANLLGAQMIITGISAEVAQSLIHLGADLRNIVTLSNLQAGITYALSHRQ